MKTQKTSIDIILKDLQKFLEEESDIDNRKIIEQEIQKLQQKDHSGLLRRIPKSSE